MNDQRLRIFRMSIVAGGVLIGLSATASAQSTSLFGNRGPTSQTGSALNNANFGGSSFSGSSFGGTPAASLAGNSTLGGTSTGNARTQGIGQTGNTGANGFVGRNDTSGRFVGNQTAGQQSFQSALGNLFSGRANRQNAASTGNRSTRSGSTIRPRQQIAFSYPQPKLTAITARLQIRMKKFEQSRPGMNGIAIALNADHSITLSGQVASPESKKLAEIMARMEPGVRSVRNELVVK